MISEVGVRSGLQPLRSAKAPHVTKLMKSIFVSMTSAMVYGAFDGV